MQKKITSEVGTKELACLFLKFDFIMQVACTADTSTCTQAVLQVEASTMLATCGLRASYWRNEIRSLFCIQYDTVLIAFKNPIVSYTDFSHY